MTRNPKADASAHDETSVKVPVCGIVMPISGMMEEYSADHWKRVRTILETAIEVAGFTPNVVWNNDQLDIIQSKILQNIYDNEIIICDLSNLNPNVMFEAGLRLSTKKPTILVADTSTTVPFDLRPFQYISYQYNLEYNAIKSFIYSLSEKLKEIHRSHSEGKYKSYVENFNFEVATPGTIDVSSSKLILDRLSRIEERIVAMPATASRDEKLIQNSINYDDARKSIKERLDIPRRGINISYEYDNAANDLDEKLSLIVRKYPSYLEVASRNQSGTGLIKGNIRFSDLTIGILSEIREYMTEIGLNVK